MEQNLIKGFAVSIATVLTVYFSSLLIPIAILVFVMLGDYLSGMTKAWVTKSIDSRIGIIGIIKKLCYLLVVSVGIACDLIGGYALSDIGIDFFEGKYIFAVIVIIWLIINELISILENLSKIGIPVPSFLIFIVAKLKRNVDVNIENEKENNR